MPEICPFFQRGYCKFGADRCDNYHPPSNGPRNHRNGPFANDSNSNRNGPYLNEPRNNRTGPFRNSEPRSERNGPFNNEPRNRSPKGRFGKHGDSYDNEKKVIRKDLAEELPQWILSAYGPIPGAPRQLFGGPGREISFEEMRLYHYESHASGNQQKAIQQAQSLVQQAQQQNQVALSDIDGAIRYIVDGGKEHPNCIDICETIIRASSTSIPSVPLPTTRPSNQFAPSTTSTGFQAAMGTNMQPFTALSTVGTGFQIGAGRNTQPFGPSVPSGSGFQTTTSTSTQPFAPSSTSGAGFQTATGTSAQPFGPSFASGTGFQTTTGTSAQQFVSASIPATSFKTAAGTNTQPFAAPSTLRNGFQTATGINTQPFPPITRPPFSESIVEPAKPFTGFTPKPEKELAKPKPANPFAPVASPPSSSNPSHSAGRSFVSLSSGSTHSPSLVQKPSATKSIKDSRGRLIRWDGRPVTYLDGEPCYKGSDGSWVKIWFPNGPPEYREVEELPIEAYDETTKENYVHLREHGTFKDGIMPTVAPRREWCRWDF